MHCLSRPQPLAELVMAMSAVCGIAIAVTMPGFSIPDYSIPRIFMADLISKSHIIFMFN